MARANEGDRVTVHYTGRLEDGTVFDSSEDREPLALTLGEGEVIPGFEEALVGMEPGESKTARIPSDAAYGPHRDDMVLTVAREQLPEGVEPSVGDQLKMRQAGGQTFLVRVTEASDREVTLDANHPLAGRDLLFDIELVDID